MSKAESKLKKRALNKSALFMLTLLSMSIVFTYIPLSSANSTIGYTSNINDTFYAIGGGQALYLVGPFTAQTTGRFGSISFYAKMSTGASVNLAVCIYSDNSGSPGNLIGSKVSSIVGSTSDYVLYTIYGLNCDATAGTSYWIGLCPASPNSLQLATQDEGSLVSAWWYKSGVKYTNLPNPAGSGIFWGSGTASIYATIISDPFTSSSYASHTKLGENTTFSAQWSTTGTLSHWIIQTNQTGTATNSTWQSFGGSTTSSYTGPALPLNISWVGYTIAWKIWANTTAGLWADTGTQYATIADASYSYTFSGVYDENTGSLIGSCNATAYFDDGTPPYSFTVNGTAYTYYPASQPLYFDYNIQPYANTTDTTINRQYWLKVGETNGVYNVFGDEIGLVHITFQIRALGGVGLSSFLEVQRIINGTYQTVEQRQVDATGVATMSLQPYTIYRVIAWSGSTSTTFGNINTYTTQITLTISALSFPNDVLMQYKYLRIWASRPSSTEIQVSYQDTNEQTVSVAYQLAFENGTIAYSNTHTGENSFIDIWSAADSNTTYYLTANVSQSTFGSSTFAQVLLRDGASTSPIDLSFLGDWPIDATQLFWAFIVFIVFGVGSVLNAYIGGFAGVATAAVLVWLGWLQVPAGGVVAAFCVVCMVGIVYWKRRS